MYIKNFLKFKIKVLLKCFECKSIFRKLFMNLWYNIIKI